MNGIFVKHTIAISCLLAASVISRSQIRIGGSCSDTENASPGQNGIYAVCGATAYCEAEHVSGNLWTFVTLNDLKRTMPFACPLGTTTHYVWASGTTGQSAMSSGTSITSANSGLAVMSSSGSNPCVGTPIGVVVQPFKRFRCKKYGGMR
jgi:hypothetical protein